MLRRTAPFALVLAGLCPAFALAQAPVDAGAASPSAPSAPVGAPNAAPAAAPATPARAESCATCHAQLTGRLREPAQSLKSKDVHAGHGLSCTSCHGGDGKQASAVAAHGGKDFLVRPADDTATAALCGKCHTAPAENFLKSRHHLAKEAARRPDCTTCHGAHGVVPASLDLIRDPLCSSCHTIDQARRIQKAVAGAETAVATLAQQLAKAGDDAAAQEKLREARTHLRGITHSLDLLTITRTATEAFTIVEEVRAKSLPKAEARVWAKVLRNIGIVVLAVLAIGVLGLAFRFLRARRGTLLPKDPRPKTTLFKVGAAVVVALFATALFAAQRTYNYVKHDPQFCTSCHTMDSPFGRWQASAHKNIDCHACHPGNPVSDLHQLVVYATSRPDDPGKHAVVDRTVCESCHTGGSDKSKWNRIAETPGHKVHAGKNHVECVQCHAMSVHIFKPPKETCATCHKQITMAAAGSMAEMHCLTCHSFTSPDPRKPLLPDRAACLDCHEKRQVMDETFPAKAPMKWDCAKCHKPHEKITLENADCKKCHLALDEGIHKVKAHVNCLDCHKPHSWSSEPTACLSCHKGKEKHNPGKACTTCHNAEDPE